MSSCNTFQNFPLHSAPLRSTPPHPTQLTQHFQHAFDFLPTQRGQGLAQDILSRIQLRRSLGFRHLRCQMTCLQFGGLAGRGGGGGLLFSRLAFCCGGWRGQGLTMKRVSVLFCKQCLVCTRRHRSCPSCLHRLDGSLSTKHVAGFGLH